MSEREAPGGSDAGTVYGLVSMRMIRLFVMLRRSGIMAQRRQFGLSETEWRIMTQLGDTAPLSLNGLLWWEKDHPDDLAAVRWLTANAVDTPVILEAYGGGYVHNGRISMATGFPTVLGWEGHEHQWRGTREEIDPRKADVERLYTTPSEVEFRELLAKYGVRYVVVGRSEKGKFGLTDADIRRYERWLTPVFESGEVRVFERR